MTRALVTGATGMVGGHLVARLISLGVPVRALVRQTSDVRELQQLDVDLAVGEFGDRAFLVEAMDGCDIVFHTAGYLKASAAFGGTGQAENRQYWDANVRLTEEILAASLAQQVKRFVFVSSTSVYGPEAVSPITEEAPTRPATAYGRSKLAAEQLIRSYQERGLQSVIVRPGIIYGAGDRYFLPTVQEILQLPVLPLIDGGNQRHDLVHASDVVELMWLASQANIAIVQVYNAGSGQPLAVRDIVAVTGRVLGRSSRTFSVSPFVARASLRVAGWYLRRQAPSLDELLTPLSMAYLGRDFVVDISRAQQLLKFRPRYGYEEGLRATVHGGS